MPSGRLSHDGGARLSRDDAKLAQRKQRLVEVKKIASCSKESRTQSKSRRRAKAARASEFKTRKSDAAAKKHTMKFKATLHCGWRFENSRHTGRVEAEAHEVDFFDGVLVCVRCSEDALDRERANLVIFFDISSRRNGRWVAVMVAKQS